MKDVFKSIYNEFKNEAVLFQSPEAAARFIANSGAISSFPVCGFCSGYFDNDETDIDKKWRQYLEAVKFGKNIIIMIRTIDGGNESVKPMSKKEHAEFCTSRYLAFSS